MDILTVRPPFRPAAVPTLPALLAAGALALLLSGCASHRQPGATDDGLALPDTWSTTEGSQPATNAAARWWQQVDDPLLVVLVNDAFTANPDLRGAQAALRQAEAQRRAARAGWWPSLDAGASAQRGKGSVQTGSAATTSRYSAGLDASWNIDLAGATARSVDAADAGVDASAATLQWTRAALAAEVAQAYIDLRSAQARRDIAARTLAAQDETLALTGWRADAGLASSLDTEQARANREQTRAQLAQLDGTLASTTHRIAVLCGKPPAALQALLATPQGVPQLAINLPDALPADVLRRRPDVRAAEARLRAEAARTDARRAARWPSLTLNGSLGVAALAVGDLTASGADTWSLLGNLSLPLLDGGRRRAEVAAQLAVEEQALADYQATVLAALEDVENALAGIRSGLQRVDALRNASEAASNALLLARHRYEAGSIDFQSLLDAERTALGVADSLVVASAQLTATRVDLLLALGGDTEPEKSSTPAADAGQSGTARP